MVLNKCSQCRACAQARGATQNDPALHHGAAQALRHGAALIGAAPERGRLVADRVWDRGSSGQSGEMVGFRLRPGRGLTHWRSTG
jgi:hypothetical protein